MKSGAKSAGDLCLLPAHRLAALLKSGEVGAVELTQAFLQRIERLNPRLNAFVTVDADGALRAAADSDRRAQAGGRRGPLDGIPVGLKDVIFTAGLRTTGGSQLYKDFVPESDAIVVKRLRAAGAVVLGKTNTSEFGHKPVTDCVLFGETRNPWNPALTPGGSSGGSSAAVAAGLCALSIGNDGGGSIRIPAAFCGVVGFKPSFGAVPQYPGFSGWELLGHTGPIAACVEDVKMAMGVIAGPDPQDPDSCLTPSWPALHSKVAFAPSLNDVSADPQIAKLVNDAVQKLRAGGKAVEEVKVNWSDPERNFTKIVAGALFGACESQDRARVDPSFAALLDYASGLKAGEYARALAWRKEFTRTVLGAFSEIEFLLTPMTPVPAFELGKVGPREIAGKKVWPFAWMSWAYPFNLTGQPAISIPCGMTAAGLPVGLQVIGRPGADAALIRFTRWAEEVIGLQPERSRIDAILENASAT